MVLCQCPSEATCSEHSHKYVEAKKETTEVDYTIAESYEPRHEKTNVLVSDQVRHKPGCTATEDG